MCVKITTPSRASYFPWFIVIFPFIILVHCSVALLTSYEHQGGRLSCSMANSGACLLADWMVLIGRLVVSAFWGALVHNCLFSCNIATRFLRHSEHGGVHAPSRVQMRQGSQNKTLVRMLFVYWCTSVAFFMRFFASLLVSNWIVRIGLHFATFIDQRPFCYGSRQVHQMMSDFLTGFVAECLGHWLHGSTALLREFLAACPMVLWFNAVMLHGHAQHIFMP